MLNFLDIRFPIYRVPESHQVINGDILVGGQYGTKLVYSKNIGGRLSSNRLKYLNTYEIIGAKLYNFTLTLFSISDLLRIKGVGKTFIDSTGKLFKYTPATRVPLKYFRIVKFRQVPSGYVLYVKGVNTRFLINRMPQLHETHIGLLEVGIGYIMYELCNELKKSTWRLI